MGIFDKAKDLLNEHNEKIDQGLDKAADFIDQKTGGKYADKIDNATEQAKDKIDEFSGHQEVGPEAPPATAPTDPTVPPAATPNVPPTTP